MEWKCKIIYYFLPRLQNDLEVKTDGCAGKYFCSHTWQMGHMGKYAYDIILCMAWPCYTFSKIRLLRYRLRFDFFYIRACIICVNRSDALQTWRHARVLTSRSIIIIVQAKRHGWFKELSCCHQAEIEPQQDKFGCSNVSPNLEKLFWTYELL